MAEQYLTIAEVAERLKLSPKTVKNKMATGAFGQGVHYFRPPGMQVRFKWSAVVRWIEGPGKEIENLGETKETEAQRTRKSKGLEIGDEQHQ